MNDKKLEYVKMLESLKIKWKDREETLDLVDRENDYQIGYNDGQKDELKNCIEDLHNIVEYYNGT